MKITTKCLLSVLVFAGVGWLISEGYDQSWTGFSSWTNAEGKTTDPKKLWDWMNLLIVPLFLALGVWFLDGSRKRSERRIQLDQQYQKTLNDYLSFMTELLLKNKLLEKDCMPVTRSIARTQTLFALRALDGNRKAKLLQFLYESGLILNNPIIQLTGADFRSANLENAVLRGAEIRGAYFQGADFRKANLDEGDFRGCDFSGADLDGASMLRASLKQANFSGVKLANVALSGTTLEQAKMPKRHWWRHTGNANEKR